MRRFFNALYRWRLQALCFHLFTAMLGDTLAASLDDWNRLKVNQPKGYLAGRIASPIKVDGKLDDPAWASAPWTDEFVDIEGDLKPKPRFKTRAKMVWDDVFFYIAADMEEPHVWGTLIDHDSVIFQDNDFEVFIDPDGDSHNYYEFELNALNTTWDLLLEKPYKNGGHALNSFELRGLKSAVHIDGTLNNSKDTDRGWSLEIAIPWKALKQKTSVQCPPQNGDLWRVSFSRVEWRHEIVSGKYRKVAGTKEDNWVWSPQGIVDMHRPERWGQVRFVRKPPGEGVFHPDPSLAVRDALQEVYYRQRTFHNNHKRYTDSLDELGLTGFSWFGIQGQPEIVLRGKGFTAKILRGLPNHEIESWFIAQDAKVWAEKSK